MRKGCRQFLVGFRDLFLRQDADLRLFGARRDIKRLAHGGDVLRGCAAAPAHDTCTHLSEGERVFAEVIRIRGIHDAPADLFGPARVWFHPKLPVGHGLAHLLQDTQQLSGSA